VINNHKRGRMEMTDTKELEVAIKEQASRRKK
jgi:hypothetical protein